MLIYILKGLQQEPTRAATLQALLNLSSKLTNNSKTVLKQISSYLLKLLTKKDSTNIKILQILKNILLNNTTLVFEEEELYVSWVNILSELIDKADI